MTQGPIQAIHQEVVGQVVGQAHAGLKTHTVTPRQKKIALAIAGTADLLQLLVFPFFVEGALSPPDDVLDVVVAVLLLVTLGFKWRVLLALAIELVPGVALFPSWTAVVASLPSAEPVSNPEQVKVEVLPAEK